MDANLDRKGQRLFIPTDQQEIDICLSCPLGDCRQASAACPLQQHMHKLGRKNIGGVKVAW